MKLLLLKLALGLKLLPSTINIFNCEIYIHRYSQWDMTVEQALLLSLSPEVQAHVVQSFLFLFRTSNTCSVSQCLDTA